MLVPAIARPGAGEENRTTAMQLLSDAFEEGQQIPVRYTKDGDNVSPPLRWRELPQGTRSLALFFENTTPQTEKPFLHWMIYGIPPEIEGLPEGFKHKAEPDEPAALRQGKNAIGNVGYDGPLGSVGRRMRFRFRLCALDQPLDLSPGSDEKAAARAMSGHVLEQAELGVVHERKE
jgi:Raf kinase inhibitor-like YbhB/YbcL family protein